VIVSKASSPPCRVVCLGGDEVWQGCEVWLIGGDNIGVAKGDVSQD
jgi:hypothetical protein